MSEFVEYQKKQHLSVLPVINIYFSYYFIVGLPAIFRKCNAPRHYRFDLWFRHIFSPFRKYGQEIEQVSINIKIVSFRCFYSLDFIILLGMNFWKMGIIWGYLSPVILSPCRATKKGASIKDAPSICYICADIITVVSACYYSSVVLAMMVALFSGEEVTAYV